jgi:hypothetical protein
MSKWVEPKGYDYEQHTTVTLKFHKKTRKITGHGTTINHTKPSPFVIEGEMLSGTQFKWNKRFSTHTSVYQGSINWEDGSVQGTIDYHDGKTHWKGQFSYTKKKKELLHIDVASSS